MAQQKKWSSEVKAKIIARAWKDNDFKQKLLKNPKEAIKEFGLEMPNTRQMKVVEESANQDYLVIPNQPAEIHKLSQAELEKIAAASCNSLFGFNGGCTK